MADIEDYSFQYDQGLETSPMGLSAASIFDEYSNDPRFVESQRELRMLLFDTARSGVATRAGTPILGSGEASDIPEFTRGNSTSREPPSFIRRIVSTGRRIMWLKNYINEVAPWLDMFDEQQAFGREVPILAKSSAPLAYAMLAISARQMEREKKLEGDLDSLQLYQGAIRSLTPQLQSRDPNTMATCVILCCLEMMSAAPRNWRRHLDGCAALFSSYGINGFSSGLPQAVFWCYARMDLCAAIISEGQQSVVLPLENWLPGDIEVPQAESYFRSSGVSDMYANYAVWLCARVCHLVWIQTSRQEIPVSGFETESFVHSWQNLWTELQNWAHNRPAELLELSCASDIANSGNGIFPFILYAAPCAISSNQLYHTGCLLLLDIKPPSINNRELGHTGSALWHARTICGISTTNAHHGCLNNAIQPLWVAGKLLSHPAEHRAVVDLIKRIEVITGWSGTWRIRDLRDIWGYDRDDPSF